MEYFIYGFAFGYFWHPVWTIAKKIWSEAKTASNEWDQSGKRK